MRKKILLTLTFLTLVVCLLAISVSADNLYGTDEEKLNKKVDITLTDGSTQTVPLYEMVSDPNHADYRKVLALTWYYDANGKLAHSYTYQVIKVSSGTVSYTGINATDVIVANFQCDASHDTSTAPGEMKKLGFVFYDSSNGMDKTENNNIQYVYLPNTLVEIQRDMFRTCPSLKVCDIKAESSIASIGRYAFHNAKSLESIHIPSSTIIIQDAESSNYGVFYGCASLKSVTFGENSQLTTIGSSAFNGCSSLTTITIPEGVTSIGAYCFRSCTNLATVKLPDTVLTVGGYAFQHSGIATSPFTLSSKCTSWGKYIFDHATSLKNLIIPAGVTRLEDSSSSNYGAVHGCTSLESVVFAPNSQLEYIGTYAFYDCTSLKKITLPDSVKTVANSAFRNAGIVDSPFRKTSGCTSIGESAFENCTSLTTFNIPAGLTETPKQLFYGCTSLVSVYFNENSQLTTVGSRTFENCTSLAIIELPQTVTILLDRVFAECDALTSFTLPNSVTTIGVRMFQGCSNLTTVNFGASLSTLVTETDNFSLTYQSAVKEVYLPATFTADSFSGGGKMTYVFNNANMVFYYAGTQEQFDAIVAKLQGTEGNTAFNTTPTVENGRLVLITACEGFYNDEHIGEKTMTYAAGFASNGCLTTVCTRCNKTVEQSTKPIIVALGYSTGSYTTTRIMIASGFNVDLDALANYEKINDVKLEIGIVFSNADKMNSEPKSLEGYNVVTDNGEKHYATYNFKVTFPAQGTAGYDTYKAREFVVAAYVCEKGEYKFYQGNDANTVVTTLDSELTTTTLEKVLEVISTSAPATDGE